MLAFAIFLAGAESLMAQGGRDREWAVTELSVNFMRLAPDYESALENQNLMGTVAEVLDQDGYWVKIKTPEPYVGWVNELGLVRMAGAQIREWIEAPKYICTADVSRVYEEPSGGSGVVSELVFCDLLKIMYKDGKAVVKKKFAGVVLPSGKEGYVKLDDVEDFEKWADSRLRGLRDKDSLRKELVSTAMRFHGVPYMWGGASIKNVDCSGLTRSVYMASGILLPRNASQQVKTGKEVRVFDDSGNVDWSELQAGDLIFWGKEATDSTAERIAHVGMYIGGSRFIHSSQVVRISSLDVAQPDFYSGRPRPLHVRRIIDDVDRRGSDIISVRKSPFYFPPIISEGPTTGD